MVQKKALNLFKNPPFFISPRLMQKPLAIQKCYGRPDGPTDRQGKVLSNHTFNSFNDEIYDELQNLPLPFSRETIRAMD